MGRLETLKKMYTEYKLWNPICTHSYSLCVYRCGTISGASQGLCCLYIEPLFQKTAPGFIALVRLHYSSHCLASAINCLIFSQHPMFPSVWTVSLRLVSVCVSACRLTRSLQYVTEYSSRRGIPLLLWLTFHHSYPIKRPFVNMSVTYYTNCISLWGKVVIVCSINKLNLTITGFDLHEYARWISRGYTGITCL